MPKRPCNSIQINARPTAAHTSISLRHHIENRHRNGYVYDVAVAAAAVAVFVLLFLFRIERVAIMFLVVVAVAALLRSAVSIPSFTSIIQ